MTKKTLIPFLFLLLCFSFACRKHSDNSYEHDIVVVGVIRSTQKDRVPIQGAKVVMGNQTAYTGETGFFKLILKDTDAAQIYVQATANGYFNGGQLLNLESDQQKAIEIHLIPQGTPVYFDPAQGLTTNIADIHFEIPPDAVLMPDGTVPNGTCQFYMANVSPWIYGDGRYTPGGTMLAKDSTGTQLLVSLGMFGAELRASDHSLLHLRPNKKVKVRIPKPSFLTDTPPAVVPTWHFDEQTGYWQREGTAQYVDGYYAFEVAHFSYWNIDIPTNFVKAQGRVLIHNQPASGINVKIQGTLDGVLGYYYSTTNKYGQYELFIPQNIEGTVSIVDECWEATSYEIAVGAHTSDFEVPDLNIDDLPAPNTIKAIITDCQGDPIPWASARFLGTVNPNWEFNTWQYLFADSKGVVEILVCPYQLEGISLAFYSSDTSLMPKVVPLDSLKNINDLGEISICQ